MANTELSIAVPLNIDLIDGKVSVPGRGLGPAIYQPNLARQVEGLDVESFAVVVVTVDDTKPFAVAFLSDGAGRELDLVSLKVALKEFEPSVVIPVQVGDGTDFRAVVFPDGNVRYVTRVHFDPALLAVILANYEDISGTWVDMLAEVEAVFQYQRLGGALSATGSQTINTAATGDPPPNFNVLVPLEQDAASVPYTLQVVATLPAPDGYILQRAEILKNVTVTKAGAVFNTQALDYTVSPPMGRADYPWPAWIEKLDVLGLSDSAGKLAVEVEVNLSGWQDPFDGGLTFGGTVWVAKVYGGGWTWSDSGGVPTIVQAAGGTGAAVTYILFDDDDPAFEIARFTINGSTVLGAKITNPAESLDEPLQLMIPQDRSANYFEIMWTNPPAASGSSLAAVDLEGGAAGDEVPIVSRAWPAASDVKIQATLLSGAEAGTVTDTVTSQEFVVRARRELIPTVVPPTS